MYVVDTNLLVYAALSSLPEHERAVALVREWRRGPERWFLPWPVMYEFVRVVTQRGAFDRALTPSQAWEFIAAIHAAPHVRILAETERHLAVVRELAAAFPRVTGAMVHDLHLVALMKEHGVSEIRTADTDFHQFKFLRVVNPLT